jgi:Lon protease-like protein
MARRRRVDHREALAQACAALKVFPLQGVTVFPGTPTPFHIFEPRYRELVRDALASDRMLAIPTMAEPGEAPFEIEPVRQIAGACFIEDYERLADGRYHVLVRGAGRVRLVDELATGKPYREFRAEILDDVLPESARAEARAKAEGLEQLLVQIAAGLPAESGATKLAADAARLGPSALADLAAAALVTDVEARYGILAEPDVLRRLDLVTAEAAAVVLAIGGTGIAKA